jgi:hypothetical protein
MDGRSSGSLIGWGAAGPRCGGCWQPDHHAPNPPGVAGQTYESRYSYSVSPMASNEEIYAIATEGRPMRLRDRVTLLAVEKCCGSEPVVINVEARVVDDGEAG